MSDASESVQRIAVRRRHGDAVVIAEMARSLHQEAGRERARASERTLTRETVCAIEAGRRVRASRAERGTRFRRPAVIA